MRREEVKHKVKQEKCNNAKGRTLVGQQLNPTPKLYSPIDNLSTNLSPLQRKGNFRHRNYSPI